MQLTMKHLKVFSYIMAMSSMVTMAMVLVTVTFKGSAVVAAPYGEAPFEIALLLMASAIIIYLTIRELKGKDFTPQEQKQVNDRTKGIYVLLITLGLLLMIITHNVTRYSLQKYPECVYETNPIMSELFVRYGFDAGLAYGAGSYIVASILIFMIVTKISTKQPYPFNMVFFFLLPAISLLIFGAFFYNAYSDIRILTTVAARC